MMLKKPLVLWLLYSWLKGALVKDGGQTVCRHIFDIATILCINEQTGFGRLLWQVAVNGESRTRQRNHIFSSLLMNRETDE